MRWKLSLFWNSGIIMGVCNSNGVGESHKKSIKGLWTQSWAAICSQKQLSDSDGFPASSQISYKDFIITDKPSTKRLKLP